MTIHALAFGIALAVAAGTLPTAGRAAPESHSGLAAPFPPRATIYRPDCWTREDPASRWDFGGCARD
jgi:hypothetical protein